MEIFKLNSKIIFLDIDGVLNTKFDNLLSPSGICYNKACIDRLNKITDETNAVLVISSSHRIGKNTSQLQEVLKEIGIKGKIIDRTDAINGYTRGQEIQKWVDENNPYSYVILDDEDGFLPEQKPFHIQTSWYDCGLLTSHCNKAYLILNKV